MINKFNKFFNTKFFLIIFRLTSYIFFKKKEFECLGKGHGKYYIPKNFFEINNENLWTLSAGVGDNITFDEELLSKGYKIIFVDPTPKAIKYFERNFDKKKYKNNYLFYKKALWKNEKKIKFFLPENDKIISNSIFNANRSKNFIEVDCITLNRILRDHKIKMFNIIKLDIEGAELNVLKDLIQNKILANILLIEFDFLKQKNLFSALIILFSLISDLKKSSYYLNYIDDLNFTFIYNKKS